VPQTRDEAIPELPDQRKDGLTLIQVNVFAERRVDQGLLIPTAQFAGEIPERSKQFLRQA
jgi:hypothetical protein